MRILGVDPSLRSTGYGVLDADGTAMTPVCHGHIKNPSTLLPSRCLVRIADKIRELIREHRPDIMVVEGLVYVQNTRIALGLGQVRGVAIAAAAEAGLPVYEYAPRKVKQAVTGAGTAGKSQVGHMTKALLGLNQVPQPDAADALALAICHAQLSRGIQIQPAREI